jgi:hypothetical protein
MNWDALGALGEIIGAIAVLVTLLYLAQQDRQSNRFAIASNEVAIRNSFSPINEIHNNRMQPDACAASLHGLSLGNK